MSKTILVTGSAGFIGFHVAKTLLERGDAVIGIDNLNTYYDQKLKKARNKILKGYKKYKFYKIDITNKQALDDVFVKKKINVICHLAAQAGVRHSFERPAYYMINNVVGTVNIFEAARTNNVNNIVYASSSSVYGNSSLPWTEEKDDLGDVNIHTGSDVDHPINPYGASKRSIELVAFTYHYLYKLNLTGLRFFSVYGPWGRPDMAYFIFTDKISRGEEIKISTHKRVPIKRDFTYIEDIVDGVLSAIDTPEPHTIYNLGSARPEDLNKLIRLLEKELGKKAILKKVPLQAGEFFQNFPSTEKIRKKFGFKPKTKLEEGIKKFVEWYKDYYKVA